MWLDFVGWLKPMFLGWIYFGEYEALTVKVGMKLTVLITII